MKRQHNRCNANFDKKKMASITKVEHKHKGSAVQSTCKSGVEAVIMKENLTKFKLVQTSLLLSPNILTELGYYADKEISVYVQRQSILFPSVDNKLQELLILFHKLHKKSLHMSHCINGFLTRTLLMKRHSLHFRECPMGITNRVVYPSGISMVRYILGTYPSGDG